MFGQFRVLSGRPGVWIVLNQTTDEPFPDHTGLVDEGKRRHVEWPHHG
jgi:hypothetical protein